MSLSIESIFDTAYQAEHSLWQRSIKSIEIEQSSIIFQKEMSLFSKKFNDLKERFLVLTPHYLFLLKTEKNPLILSVMDIKWVRAEFTYPSNALKYKDHFKIRLIKNMIFTDLWTKDASVFREWEKHLSKIMVLANFHEKYNTIRLIGKGSFAKVYMIEDKITKEKFALKAFNKERILSKKEGKPALMNEVSILRMLDHPNIMKLLEIHESKNSVYLVLELLEGGTLRDVLTEKTKMDHGLVFKHMKSLLSVLSYLSNNKIIHRDLKLDNLIFTDKSRKTIKVIDFGFATKYNIDEYIYKKCGTPGFIAPEIINALNGIQTQFSPKCDIFSMGVIFYSLLTGNHVFEAESQDELISKNKRCKIKLREKYFKKNKTLMDLLLGMLEIDPQKRISADDALKHKFFNISPTELQHISYGDGLDPRIWQLNKYRFVTNKNENQIGSLIIKQTAQRGNIRSIHGSFNSINSLGSFHHVRNNSHGNKKHSSRKQSLLKKTIMNKKKMLQNKIPKDPFKCEYFDSVESDKLHKK